MQKVFVYGTLKSFGAIDLGRHVPGARIIGNAQVQGEIRHSGIPYLLPHRARFAFYTGDIFSSHDTILDELIPHVRQAQPWDDTPGVPVVHGEVWSVPDEHIARLDMVEGVCRNRDGSFYPSRCHYLPVRVLAMMEDGQTLFEALAYSYNVLDGRERWERLELIPDGDFSRDILMGRRPQEIPHVR